MNRIGGLLLRSNLFKLPQLLNVLRGDMSLVGPRPESPDWYREQHRRLHFLHRRLMVRPGITGLAQVKYRFDYSQKLLPERVKFDIVYVENLSLVLDMRIALRSFLLLFRRPESRLPDDS